MLKDKMNKSKESYVEKTIQETVNKHESKERTVKSEKLRYKNADDLYE